MTLIEQMNSLAAKDADTVQRQRNKALEEYRQILRRGDKPKPGDAAKLADLLSVLRIPQESLEADLNAVRQAMQAEADLLAPERLAAINAEAAAVVEELDGLVMKHHREREAVTAKLDRTVEPREMHKLACQTLARLRGEHPHLFE